MFNLLNAALSIIPPVTVDWRRDAGRTQNAIGQWVTSYTLMGDITGSFQPVERSKYEALGLDMNQHYYVLYASQDLRAVERGSSGDIIIHDGKAYQAEDAADWLSYNGWRGLLVVEIQDATIMSGPDEFTITHLGTP